jgi:hypothetical protein
MPRRRLARRIEIVFERRHVAVPTHFDRARDRRALIDLVEDPEERKARAAADILEAARGERNERNERNEHDELHSECPTHW